MTIEYLISQVEAKGKELIAQERPFSSYSTFEGLEEVGRRSAKSIEFKAELIAYADTLIEQGGLDNQEAHEALKPVIHRLAAKFISH